MLLCLMGRKVLGHGADKCLPANLLTDKPETCLAVRKIVWYYEMSYYQPPYCNSLFINNKVSNLSLHLTDCSPRMNHIIRSHGIFKGSIVITIFYVRQVYINFSFKVFKRLNGIITVTVIDKRD